VSINKEDIWVLGLKAVVPDFRKALTCIQQGEFEAQIGRIIWKKGAQPSVAEWEIAAVVLKSETKSLNEVMQTLGSTSELYQEWQSVGPEAERTIEFVKARILAFMNTFDNMIDARADMYKRMRENNEQFETIYEEIQIRRRAEMMIRLPDKYRSGIREGDTVVALRDYDAVQVDKEKVLFSCILLLIGFGQHH
jgi:hypothetical protein